MNLPLMPPVIMIAQFRVGLRLADQLQQLPRARPDKVVHRWIAIGPHFDAVMALDAKVFHRYSEPHGWRTLRLVILSSRRCVGLFAQRSTRSRWCAMKIDIDLKAGFLQELKREVLATLTPEERARIFEAFR